MSHIFINAVVNKLYAHSETDEGGLCPQELFIETMAGMSAKRTLHEERSLLSYNDVGAS